MSSYYLYIYDMNICGDFLISGLGYIRTAESFFLDFHFWDSKGRMLGPVGATFDSFSTFK